VKVYVVVCYSGYEDGDIVGIYRSKDKAEAYVDERKPKLKSKIDNVYTIQEHELED